MMCGIPGIYVRKGRTSPPPFEGRIASPNPSKGGEYTQPSLFPPFGGIKGGYSPFEGGKGDVILRGGFLLLLLLTHILCFSQTRYYVSATGTPAGNALSWATACNDLQLVINNTQKGDTIWVAQGTYVPIRPMDSLNKIDSNNRDNAFTFVKGIAVYGGFAGWESNLSQRQLPFKGSNGLSILSGEMGRPNDSTDNAFHVLVIVTQQDTVILDGFTITKGSTFGNVYPHRYKTINGKRFMAERQGNCICNMSYLVATHISVVNNFAYNGSIFANGENDGIQEGGCLNLSYSIVSDNSAWGLAAGICACKTDVNIYQTDISRNGPVSYYTGTGYRIDGGGGVYFSALASCTLTNVSITDNIGERSVSGIQIDVSTVHQKGDIVWTDLLVANNVSIYGDGSLRGNEGINIYLDANELHPTFPFIITNLTLVNNGIDYRSSIYGNNPLQIRNSILAYPIDDGVYTNCLFQRSNTSKYYLYNTPPGSFIADPMFVDTAARDYRLQCGSPAVNMGINAFYHPDSLPNLSHITTDLDDNPRFYQNGTIDLGCYELQDYCKPLIAVPSEMFVCEGDSIDIPIYISGELPCMLVYTANGQQDTLKNITNNPYLFRRSPQQDTTLYVFTYIQDKNYDNILNDSILVSILHVPRLLPLSHDTLCSGGQTKAVQFIYQTTDSCSWKTTGDAIYYIPFGQQTGDFGSYTVENEDITLRTTTVNVEMFTVSNYKVCRGDTGSFSITVRPLVKLQAGVNDSLFCEGDSILFVLFNSDDVSDIRWQSNGEFLDTGQNMTIADAKPVHSGIYIVKASSSTYCVLFDTVKITVLSAVITSLDDTLFMCDWKDITVYSNAEHANAYLWNTGDTTKNIKVSSSGIYTLQASNERCFVLDTIVVLQFNVSDFEIVTTGDLCADGKVELTASVDSLRYLWNTGDTTRMVSISVEGLYAVSAAAGPCRAYQEIEIICPCSLSLPNFFTPNNDGYNDEYIPQVSFELHTFSMIIYNRWGDVVYRTETYQGWNGKINGRDASAGVYFCVVEYSCKDNPKKKRFANSSITLMR